MSRLPDKAQVILIVPNIAMAHIFHSGFKDKHCDCLLKEVYAYSEITFQNIPINIVMSILNSIIQYCAMVALFVSLRPE